MNDTLNGRAVGAITGYRFQKYDATSAAEALKFSTATSGTPAGISDLDAASGDGINIVTSGRTKLYCDGSSVNIAIGDPLTPTTAGAGIKATVPGTVCIVEALEPLTSTGIISVRFRRKVVGEVPVVITDATDDVTVDAEDMGLETTVILSVAGTGALAIPGAATLTAGTRLTVKKTGSAGAITITPGAGTIAGGATHAALDAQNDIATFMASGSDWVIVSSNIA